MLDKTLKIATRQSPLALWQANYVKDRLQQLYPDLIVELVPMVTKGDVILDSRCTDAISRRVGVSCNLQT